MYFKLYVPNPNDTIQHFGICYPKNFPPDCVLRKIQNKKEELPAS